MIIKMKTSIALALVSMILGCGHSFQRTYIAPNYAPTAMRKIVVAPFQNLTMYPHAGIITSDLIATELIRRGGLIVVKRKKLERYLATRKMKGVIIDRSLATKIGRALKADGVLYGSVSEYWYQETKERYPDWEPAVGVNARLVKVKSGTVVWAMSTSHSGGAAFTYLFHDSKEAFQDVARETVKEICSSLLGD